MLDVLGRVRSLGYRVGLISDCTPELPDLWALLPYGEVLDATVFSCELGYRKPAAALYQELARRLDVSPPQCLYVGDGSSGELRGAEETGMVAVMVRTPFADDFRYDAESDWQGPTIEDLTQVLPLLSHPGED